jgi:outer membrane protein OmpA-like peptidoglycan-associated protein
VKFALAQRGVEPQRIDARGMGPNFPVASNDSEAGRQQNRRVEVVIR